MDDYAILRKQFMQSNSYHPMVKRSTPNRMKEKSETKEEDEKLTIMQRAKKAAVAVSGGALVVVGIPMIPFPVPCGCIMVAGGFSVLATEFPVAQRLLDKGKVKLRNFAENHGEEEKVEGDFEVVENTQSVSNQMGKVHHIHNDDKAVHSERSCVNPKKRNQVKEWVTRNTILPLMKQVMPLMNEMKESLRNLVRNTILPLLNHSSEPKIEYQDDDIVLVDNTVNHDEEEEKVEDDFESDFEVVENTQSVSNQMGKADIHNDAEELIML